MCIPEDGLISHDTGLQCHTWGYVSSHGQDCMWHFEGIDGTMPHVASPSEITIRRLGRRLFHPSVRFLALTELSLHLKIRTTPQRPELATVILYTD